MPKAPVWTTKTPPTRTGRGARRRRTEGSGIGLIQDIDSRPGAGPGQYPLGVYLRPEMPGYSEHKQDVRARLSRIEGQVRGIERMVDEDRYCIDILTQVNAVKAAIDKVALILLEDHVEHCVADAVKAGEGEEKVHELTDAIGRFLGG